MIRERLTEIIEMGLPCFVIAREGEVPPVFMDVANELKVSLFRSPLTTMEFMNNASFLLEAEFAETTNIHGCMITYRGIGLLIMGQSGSGKSEAAIGMIERGAALVADDKVKVRKANGELVASTEDFSKGFIEMRGVGIMNVANLFGLGSIRDESKIELIVFLKPEADLNNVDRVGVVRKTYDVLGIGVPYVEIPVAPGLSLIHI